MRHDLAQVGPVELCLVDLDFQPVEFAVVADSELEPGSGFDDGCWSLLRGLVLGQVADPLIPLLK